MVTGDIELKAANKISTPAWLYLTVCTTNYLELQSKKQDTPAFLQATNNCNR